MTREQAVDLLDNLVDMVDDNHGADYDTALKMGIEALKQSRMKGKWGKEGECPFCGYLQQWDDDKFCANCGADMRGEE